MTHQNNSVPKKSSVVYEMNEKGVIIVSPTLAAQITALHKIAGRNEWSGILLFRTINEDLEHPKNFRIVAEGVYPMDFGSGAYTEYDFSEDVLEVFEVYPKSCPETNRAPWKFGHIHTHHSMGAYFSGTDNTELRDNANKYPYYVSLVVDFAGTYAAKVAFMAKTDRTTSYKVKNKWRKINHQPEEVLVTADLEVRMTTDAWFDERVKDLRRSKPIHHIQHHSPSSPSITNSVIKPPSGITNQTSLWAKLRDKASYLFLKDKQKASTTVLYYVWKDLSETLPTEADKNRYVNECMERVQDWLEEHFSEEVKANIYAEERILRTLIQVLDGSYSTDTLLPKIITGLKEYVALNYDTDYPSKETKKEPNVTQEIESLEDQWNRQYGYNGVD